MQKKKMRSICWTVKHTTLPKYPFCYFTHPSSLKGVGKPHLKLTQFNNSLKENEGQSIVQEIVKRYKLFKTCYYKITQRSCKYSPSPFHVICDSRDVFCPGLSIGYQCTFVFSSWTAKQFHRSEHLSPVRSIKYHCLFILWKMKYMLVELSCHMYKQFTFHFVSVERGWRLMFF